MATFFGYLWPFLIYFVILFVVCYVVVEYGQTYLYDEATPAIAAKVALGAAILATVLTLARVRSAGSYGFATMFTAEIAWTLVLAIAWSGAFILIFRFQPWHGFGLAMATLLIFAGLSTLVVDSMLSPKPAGRIDTTKENKPLRRPVYAAPTPTKGAPAPK